MVSKAPPVPQPSHSQEPTTNREADGQVSPQNATAEASGEELPNPASGDRIIEEQHDGPLNANPGPEGTRESGEVPPGHASAQQLRPETRVHKPADDHLFTWAAVGLTFAIVVLLFKKFMKASGYAAVFMDGS
ncbi:unnamed protein product [Ilex paraguariensis]|uniref:Uncharacterized protein n=1 Tax=Ilex paraguariensis TaxID=185542 RepID=A0ABC8R2I3_9AQUA